MATSKNTPEARVREIKRNTRRIYNSEEKIRIILEGLRGEDAIAEICRREGIHPSQYYKWSKEFLEAGKKRLNGDMAREATSTEVKDLREENEALKQLVAELSLKNRMLKKAQRVWNKAGLLYEVQPMGEVRNHSACGGFLFKCDKNS
jgi:transposase-like protein